jgi:hypothetical protein
MSNNNEQLEILKREPFLMKYINDLSEEVQLAVIDHNGNTIQFIKNPSKEVQLAAVQKNICLIEYIDNPEEEVKKYVADRIDFHIYAVYFINKIQEKIKDYITKEIYYSSPKDFPWISEIKERFKDIDRFKRFNL